jgi:hypothetical protein
MLFAVLEPINRLPTWQATFPDRTRWSGVGQELQTTDGLIVETLAQSVSECMGDTTRIEEKLSESDPEIVAALHRRMLLWERALGATKGRLPWPTDPKDVWVHAVRQLPPKLPADFPKPPAPKIVL